MQYTRNVVYLEDGEIAVITKDSFETRTIDNVDIEKEVHQVTIDIEEIEKGGFEHFMLKEIMEQPETLAKLNARTSAARGREL